MAAVMAAQQSALRLLARREHSQRELRDKLRLRGFAKEEIVATLSYLAENDWQSDHRFVEGYVRMRQQKGYGPLRIMVELQERGIEEALIAALVVPNDDSWLAQLAEVYRKKFSNRKIKDLSDKAKRMRFLQYRGFTAEQIRSVI